MRLISDTDHRVLAYLVALEGQAYHPMPDEVNAYAKNADRVTTTTMPAFELAFANILPAAWRGTTHTETAVQWLVRLKLAQEQNGGLYSTRLGRALLAAANEQEAMLESSPTIAIVLKQDDDFALAMVMAKIAEVGSGSLVDPFLHIEGFVQVAQNTKITRIITGPDAGAGRLRALSAGRAALDGIVDVVPEIRVADVFHDRYLIPDAGPIWMLGTSLNGVGKKTSAMVQVADEPGGRAIRATFQEEWAKARAIADFLGDAGAAASPSKKPK